MPIGRITKRAVDVLECRVGGRTFTLWETIVKGFGVVTIVRSVRSDIPQYRMGGRGSKVRRYTIGRHGSPWTADTARQHALDLFAEIRTSADFQVPPGSSRASWTKRIAVAPAILTNGRNEKAGKRV